LIPSNNISIKTIQKITGRALNHSLF